MSQENALGGRNFGLLSSAEEVKTSNAGAVGRAVGTRHDCSQMHEISSRQHESIR